MTIAAPTVHMNGTSRQELLKQFLDARSALRTAYSSMCAAAPNGRDYYVQSRDAFTTAQEQHRDRLQRIEALITEYETLAEGVIE